MDPVTAACNMVTAFLTWSSARFAAATPADQAAIATIDAAMLKQLVDLVQKVHSEFGVVLDKVKGIVSHPAP